MNDTVRELTSYFGLYYKVFRAKKVTKPEYVPFGKHKDQYFLYYEPENPVSDKVVIWIHGGGWNSGNPKMFDAVGQCAAREGYRFVSIGYRLSPVHKYPCQIKDVCAGFNAAVKYLAGRGADTSKLIVSGPSAGAQLASVLCYSKTVQKKCGADISGVIGFIGTGGPYCFTGKHSLALKMLLDQLFKKGYDRRNAEPLSLLKKNNIPMLLIQSRHDGVIDFSSAKRFSDKARMLGMECELYEVTDKKNTHSWYTTGMFLETREENMGLDKFFSFIEKL